MKRESSQTEWAHQSARSVIETCRSACRGRKAPAPALKGLGDVDVSKLRQAALVGIAYAQLLSMSSLADLGKLAQARAEALAQADASARGHAEQPHLAVCVSGGSHAYR